MASQAFSFDGAESRVPIKEAAELLSVSTDTVRRRLRDGRLKGEMVDGIWMVEVPHAPATASPGSIPANLVISLLQKELDRRAEEMESLRGIIRDLTGKIPGAEG